MGFSVGIDVGSCSQLACQSAPPPAALSPRDQREMEFHTSSDKKLIKKLLQEGKVDINHRNDIGEAPIHTLVRNASQKGNAKKPADSFDCLWTYLVYCDSYKFDINIKSEQGWDTALHIAAENNDLDLVKALLIFGADVNRLDILNRSPIDHAIIRGNQEMIVFLQTRGALEGATLLSKQKTNSTDDPLSCMPVKAKMGGGLTCFQFEVDQPLHYAVGETPLELNIHNGQRILCLDGGGLKGLILIEVLIHIERMTGKKIVELFDWIVGTSTGGIIALALVYAKKSLQDLKQLFFQLKDDVFGTATFGYGCNTNKLEEILKSYFGDKMKLKDVAEPRVIITAVNRRQTDLKLVFFNNCLYEQEEEEKYRDVLVWEAARYTSAAPVFFDPAGDYIDGGMKANNPTDFALTQIQKHFDIQDKVLKDNKKGTLATKYACVVSVGCGIFKPQDLGNFSIQKYFGVRALELHKFIPDVLNLLKLLGNAISSEEEVAESCRLRCEKQGIPFYRFSPSFADSDLKVPAGETNIEKLCELITRAQSCLYSEWAVPVQRLANLLKRVEKSRNAFKF